MFVCKDCCEEQNKWRFGLKMGKSYGRCEICHSTKPCIDEKNYKYEEKGYPDIEYEESP